jgi:hypothetical protein
MPKTPAPKDDPTALPDGALDESLQAAIASGSAPSGFAVNDDGTPAEPQPVHDDGSPILPPPSTGAQDPTVVVDDPATVDADVVPADASGNPDAQPNNALGDAEGVPEITGYCHNAECVVATVQLWKPLDEAPVMCQCGQMLHAEPLDQAQPADVVEDAPPA